MRQTCAGCTAILIALVNSESHNHLESMAPRSDPAFHIQTLYPDKPSAVAAMSAAARKELEEWARMPMPTMSPDMLCAQLVCMLTWLGRPIGFGTWFCRGKGFWRTYARLGGEDREDGIPAILRRMGHSAKVYDTAVSHALDLSKRDVQQQGGAL